MLTPRATTTTVARRAPWSTRSLLRIRPRMAALSVEAGLLVRTSPGRSSMVRVTIICRVTLLESLKGQVPSTCLILARLTCPKIEVTSLLTLPPLTCSRVRTALQNRICIPCAGPRELLGRRNIQVTLLFRYPSPLLVLTRSRLLLLKAIAFAQILASRFPILEIVPRSAAPLSLSLLMMFSTLLGTSARETLWTIAPLLQLVSRLRTASNGRTGPLCPPPEAPCYSATTTWRN